MRSLKAAEKLPYAVKTDLDWAGSDTFHLYEIPKDMYTLYSMRTFEEENRRLKEA